MLDGLAEPFELKQYIYSKYHGWMMFDTDYNFPRSVHQRWMFDAFRIPGVLGEVLGTVLRKMMKETLNIIKVYPIARNIWFSGFKNSERNMKFLWDTAGFLP